jgi:hypothetical protein
VGALDAELIEDGDSVGRAKRHRVSLRIVGLVAAPEAAVVRVDQPELAGRQGLRDVGLSHVDYRVQEPSVKNYRRAVAAVILEVDTSSIQRIQCIGHDSADPSP